ncbi:hypothetical protein D3C76_180510 [compost metagenome]
MVIHPSIYWIAGSSCSGKSSIARMFAEQYGFNLYACDEHVDEHLRNISPNKQPAMHQISRMNANEVFYTRKIQEQLRTYIDFFIEDFDFVLKDLTTAEPQTPLVVEGNQLLPFLIAPYLQESHKAIWIVPTEPFQWAHYSKRTWIDNILKYTDDPVVAFRNWMTRDVLFAEFIQQ